MYTLQTILTKLRQYKPELEKKYPVTNIGVFGSYARGEATDKSDIAPLLVFVQMALQQSSHQQHLGKNCGRSITIGCLF